MDKLQALKVFIAVANANSFSVAADRLNLSPPMISRYIAWLEESVGARLLNRTTRRLSLTEAGSDYLQRTSQVIEALEEADTIVAQGEAIRGKLRVTAPTCFGVHQLMPIVIQFMKDHPDVTIELILENHRFNIVEEGLDLAIRIAHDIEPGLIARKLCVCRSVICASPAYLKQHGYPDSLASIAEHECLMYTHFQRETWKFKHENKIREIEVQGRLTINNMDALLTAALAGMGLAHHPTYLVGELIRSGQLEVVTIPDHEFISPDIYAVYPSRNYLPPKVRVFINALAKWTTPIPAWDQGVA